MPSRAQEKVLFEAIWERVEPLLPIRKILSKGGRPAVSDKACLRGILFLLRSGCRWNDLDELKGCPSSATCWRRYAQWTKSDLGKNSSKSCSMSTRKRLGTTFANCSATRPSLKTEKGGLTGKTKCGIGMKVELITDGRGTPVAVVVDAAHAAETDLCAVAIDHLPITLPIPECTPLIYDKAADSDSMRDRLAKRNLHIVAPHRENRQRPSRNDGRTLRKYKRRYIVERTIAWFHHYRRAAVHYDLKPTHYEGFVSLACTMMMLSKAVVK